MHHYNLLLFSGSNNKWQTRYISNLVCNNKQSSDRLSAGSRVIHVTDGSAEVLGLVDSTVSSYIPSTSLRVVPLQRFHIANIKTGGSFSSPLRSHGIESRKGFQKYGPTKKNNCALLPLTMRICQIPS